MKCNNKELVKLANENGIFLKEEGDEGFVYHITPDRHIRCLGEKPMSSENMEKMYRLADYGNMEYMVGLKKKEALIKSNKNLNF